MRAEGWMVAAALVLLSGVVYAVDEEVWPEVWEARGPDRVYRLVEGMGSVRFAALTPDGRYAAVVHESYMVDPRRVQAAESLVGGTSVAGLSLIDLDKGREVRRLAFPEEIVWDHETMLRGSEQRQLMAGTSITALAYRGTGLQLGFSRDGQRLVLIFRSRPPETTRFYDFIRLHSVETGERLASWSRESFFGRQGGGRTFRIDRPGRFVDVIEQGEDYWRITRQSLGDLSHVATIEWKTPESSSDLFREVLGEGAYPETWPEILTRHHASAYVWRPEDSRLRLVSSLFPGETALRLFTQSRFVVVDFDTERRGLLRSVGADVLARYRHLGLSEDGVYAWAASGRDGQSRFVYDVEQDRVVLSTDSSSRPALVDLVDGHAMVVEHHSANPPENAQANRTFGYLRRWSLPEAEPSEARTVDLNWPATMSTLVGIHPPADRAMLLYSSDGSRAVNFVNGEARVYEFGD